MASLINSLIQDEITEIFQSQNYRHFSMMSELAIYMFGGPIHDKWAMVMAMVPCWAGTELLTKPVMTEITETILD